MGKKLILNWLKISIISKTKFVTNILLFILFVPIISKIFEKFGNEISFTINNNTHTVIFNLPFSLGLFYYSALLFLLGNIIYKIFVPSIIDENKSFNDFISEGKGKNHLIGYYEKDTIDLEIDCTSLYSESNIQRDELSEYFWSFWENSLNQNKIIRFIISLLYTFGILIIIFLFIQNICYVTKTMQILPEYNEYLNFILDIGK